MAPYSQVTAVAIRQRSHFVHPLLFTISQLHSLSPNMSYGYPAPSIDLPYPWISQFDSNYQTAFYVNTVTGETSWNYPSPADVQQSSGGFKAGASGYEASYEPVTTSSFATTPSGQAASFYGNAGPAAPPSNTYSSQSAQLQSPMANSAGDGEPGERGLGKVVLAGGALYLAHKLYKDWQKNKLSTQQQSLLKPPQYAPRQQPPPNQGGYGRWTGRSQAFDPQEVYSQPQSAWSSTSSPGPTTYGQPQPAYQRPPSHGSTGYNPPPTSQFSVSLRAAAEHGCNPG